MKYLFGLTLLLLIHFAHGQNGRIPGEPGLAYWVEGTGAVTIIVLHGGPAGAHDYLLPEFGQLSKSANSCHDP
jgi:hypothetical protein